METMNTIETLRRCQTGYAEMKVKQKQRLYAIFEAVFTVALRLRHSKEDTAALYHEPYWKTQRRVRGESDRDLFRDLWRFVTKAESGYQNKRASKYAAAMAYLELGHIPPEKVPEKLRMFGGIEGVARHGLVLAEPKAPKEHGAKRKSSPQQNNQGRSAGQLNDEPPDPPDEDHGDKGSSGSAGIIEPDRDVAYVKAARKPPLVIQVSQRGLRRLTSMKKGGRATIEIELTGTRDSGWSIFATRHITRHKRADRHDDGK